MIQLFLISMSFTLLNYVVVLLVNGRNKARKFTGDRYFSQQNLRVVALRGSDSDSSEPLEKPRRKKSSSSKYDVYFEMRVSRL